MDSQYLTPKMMEQHLTLLRQLKSEAVAPMPLSTLKTARSALRSSVYNLQTSRESSYMDDDDDMLYHQAGAPNMCHHPPSYFDCAPVKNNVQCSYEFLEDNRDSCQTNQIYCNTSANCVPQEAMDALKWAIDGIQKLKVLPKQEILPQPFKAFGKSEGKEVNFDLSSVSGDGASTNRIDIEGSLMSEQATKRSNSETEKDMQLNQLIDLVRLTIVKLDNYITLSQKEQQQMNQNQQGNQLNIEPYLMSTELRPHVDMITDPALQSMLFNKVRQKVRMKRTVKVMPVQPLVIIHPSTPPQPDPASTQAANTTRPADRYRVRKRRRHGGIESSHNSVKNKRDCGTTMWCPNPDCQCSNGLSSQQQELRLDLPQSQSCGTRKNTMSVGKEMDMRSTALPMLLKKLLKRHKCCDKLRSESPLNYAEDVQEDEQQLEHEQEVDSDQDWEYPTGYREYELEPEEEEWSHLPNNLCSCKRRQTETSEASSQVDYPKRKQRKCIRTVQKSSLKSKGCNKVKFNKRVIVKNLTDDEHERPKCMEHKTERAAPSGRTSSSKCRVLKSMWEADQKRLSLAEEYSRRSKGGADSMLPCHYPTKWTQ